MVILEPFQGILKDSTPVRRDSVRLFRSPVKSQSIQRGAVVSSGKPGPEGYRRVPLGAPFVFSGRTSVKVTTESPGVFMLEVVEDSGLVALCWRSVEEFPVGAPSESIGMFQYQAVVGRPVERVNIARWDNRPDADANRMTGGNEQRNPPPRALVQGDAGAFTASNNRLGCEYLWFSRSAPVGTKALLYEPAIWVPK